MTAITGGTGAVAWRPWNWLWSRWRCLHSFLQVVRKIAKMKEFNVQVFRAKTPQARLLIHEQCRHQPTHQPEVSGVRPLGQPAFGHPCVINARFKRRAPKGLLSSAILKTGLLRRCIDLDCSLTDICMGPVTSTLSIHSRCQSEQLYSMLFQ